MQTWEASVRGVSIYPKHVREVGMGFYMKRFERTEVWVHTCIRAHKHPCIALPCWERVFCPVNYITAGFSSKFGHVHEGGGGAWPGGTASFEGHRFASNLHFRFCPVAFRRRKPLEVTK